MNAFNMFAAMAAVSLAIGACSGTTAPTCDGGAALPDGGCPAAPIVGTWTNNTVSTDDALTGVTANMSSLTFQAGTSFSFASTKTYGGAALANANCTEAVAGTGNYMLSGTNTISMLLSAAMITRTNCLNPARNGNNQALTTAELAYVNTFLAVLNTYTLSGTLLTLSNTTDGGTSSATVFTRSM